MGQRELRAVELWRDFATSCSFTWNGVLRTWAEHISGQGYADEERLVQPVVFPRFAEGMLGWQIGQNLAPEELNAEGKPDFTPADSVTHPFVFETKSTNAGVMLSGFDEQVHRYLVEGRPRIKQVVLTNLVGVRIFELAPNDQITEISTIDLKLLLAGTAEIAAAIPAATRLADLLDLYRRKELSPEQKIDRVRNAPPWNPIVEVTSNDWILARVDQMVALLTANVDASITAGALEDVHVTPATRLSIVDELCALATRIAGSEVAADSLATFVAADVTSTEGAALRQFCAHVAYFAATRLLLVRVWEDLDLLEPMLYDGGFDHQMDRFDGVIGDVVRQSFSGAEAVYPSLFDSRNNYTWFRPDPDTYIEIIYELANTYLGAIKSDVLGKVYERLLERVDRKLLGQYYTPRDIISVIWDLIDVDSLATGEGESLTPTVLDIATGSGGFLVEGASRLGQRLENQIRAGSTINVQEWLESAATNFVGVEVQRFPAYLAELNLLVQLGQVVAKHSGTAIPLLRILAGDTLSLHNCDGLPLLNQSDLLDHDADTVALATRIIEGDSQFDVACGNPPYIGQKVAAPLIDRMRRSHPYWEQFVGHHMDYLYWFLILGISKLRNGGRFGFVTTEYWLRAVGAKPLRKYLANECQVERLVLLRRFKPFEDAQGQDTLLVIGRRQPGTGTNHPRVSIYEGSDVDAQGRAGLMSAVQRGVTAFGVRSFAAGCSPKDLGDGSWSPMTLTKEQFERRKAIHSTHSLVEIDPVQGVVSSANRMRSGYDTHLSVASLREIGWPQRKHGIFILTSDEKKDLGELTETESQRLRPFVNTADVLPYATILPEPCDHILFMNAGPNSDLNAPFPDDCPNIERHLLRFKPLLESKVREYNEARPWWSLHRPRKEITERPPLNAKWSDFVLTRNWGSGSRLVAGLAPLDVIPAQGLNALMSNDVSAAYLSGMLNSTPIQQLATTLPPGYLRVDDFYELGIPQLSEDLASQIETDALTLADLVIQLVNRPTFPAIRDALLDDVSLAVPPKDIWLPKAGSAGDMGTISSVPWIEVSSQGSLSSNRMGVIEVQESLWGGEILVRPRDHSHAHVRLVLAAEAGDALDALVAYLRGEVWKNAPLAGAPRLPIFVDSNRLTDSWISDCIDLDQVAADYQNHRANIDKEVAELL